LASALVKYRVLAAVGCFFAGLRRDVRNLQCNGIARFFDMTATLWLIIYVYDRGNGNFAGPIIGTLVLFLLA